MMDEPKITPEIREQLEEAIETIQVLDAVDHLDRMRSHIGDRDINTPPQIRDDLMKLHSILREVLSASDNDTSDHGLFELVWDIEENLYPVLENVQKILDLIEQINQFSEVAYEDEEEQDN